MMPVKSEGNMTDPIFAYEARGFAGMDELLELAVDLRWSWDHGADDIWGYLQLQKLVTRSKSLKTVFHF